MSLDNGPATVRRDMVSPSPGIECSIYISGDGRCVVRGKCASFEFDAPAYTTPEAEQIRGRFFKSVGLTLEV